MRTQITHLTLREEFITTPELRAAFEAFYRRCQAMSLSPLTVKFYQQRFAAFERYLTKRNLRVTPGEITPDIIRDFLCAETTRVSASTADDGYVTLKAFCRYLVRNGVIAADLMSNVERPKQKKVVITPFTKEQVEAMLGVCKSDFVGVRNRAIILLLLDCGLRVSELCGIEMNHIDWTEQMILVCGKGNKERRVPFGRVTRAAMLTYLERRGDVPGTTTPTIV